MPKLKRYADGRGHYLAGHIPEVGFCTWQIGKEGLAYLAARGVASHGDTLRIDDLREMLDRGLVGTAGGGTSPTPATPAPPWVGPLADGLVTWSLSGGVDALSVIVCPQNGVPTDSRPRCFPMAFVTWLSGLDADAGLVHLARLSPAEFEGLAVDAADGLRADPLFEHLIDRGAVGVLWRLGRLVGAVAVRTRTCGDCPAEWQSAPLLSWLFCRVKECGGDRAELPRPDGPPRLAKWKGPQIVWTVDLQQVTALVPAQPLPAGVTRVGWRVGRGRPIYPPILPVPPGRQLEESVSEALPPANVYEVELVPTGAAGGQARWTIGCPAAGGVVLFRTDGRLLDGEDAEPLPPGRYLALLRSGRDTPVSPPPGVSLVEAIPAGPIGWPGWAAWRVELGPGATVPGYRVADAAPAARWEVEPPVDAGVRWLETCPVLLGQLPRIRMEPAEAFRGAVVEVSTAARGAGNDTIYLTLGRDVPVQMCGGACVADLNAVSRLQPLLGRFLLTCHPLGGPDGSPPVLAFNRLPGLAFEYVPDPRCPTAATAVRVTSNGSSPRIAAGADTEALSGQGGDGLTFRSTSPESAPAVYLRSPAGDWDARVRIAVSRAGTVSGAGGFQGWHPLPVEDMDLARVGLGDRLRIEFHAPPVTEGGKLVSRLPGRGELLVGQPVDPPAVFEIPLHRWRDAFGMGSCGVVQIRGATGWLDAVRLVSAEPTEFVPATSPLVETWWQQLSAEVDRAATDGDTDVAGGLITRCLDAANRPSSNPCASDLLPLAAARAALAAQPPSEWGAVRSALDRLRERADLPEAHLLAVVLDIRRTGRPASAGEWSLARVEQTAARLPDSPLAAGVRAECWYRLARSADGPALGCWRACADWAERHLTSGLPESGIAFSDALLLRDLARLALGSPSVTGPVPAGVHRGHRGWIDAVRFAARFVRQPWNGRANPDVRLDLTAAAPSVLCPEDAALIRVLVGIASGRGEPERHWSLVAGLPGGYFYALPLLRARYARHVGSPTAEDEYAGAWAAFLSGSGADTDLLDVIAVERP